MVELELKKESKLFELINSGQKQLEETGNRCSRREAELLLGFLLHCERAELYLDRQRTVPESLNERFQEFIVARSKRVPLQYLINEVYFFGLKLQIAEGVFIPRPETEVLVERIINIANTYFRKSVQMLELCTGCGNISVALTKNLPDCKIIATDINSKAVAKAQENADLHGVGNQISFLRGNLFAGLPLSELPANKFDIIIANPPYLACREIENLPREVYYEPQDALNGGRDGLIFFERIVSGCHRYLNKGGFIAFEFGDHQKKEILKIINRSGIFENPVFFADLNGIYRFITARRTDG